MERIRTCVVIVAAALMACSNEGPNTDTTITSATPETAPPNQGPAESVYQLERRTEIRIEIAEADWEALRYEGRSVANLEQRDYEYNAYVADVIVDGVLHEGVEIKKKGFIGSVSALRPSLRLDFQRGGVDLDTGLRRLTLNGDVQDRTHVRQCVAFDLFARAGVPTPRCGLAHVFVNGKSLGTYTNVEPVREPMLRRHFADSDGNLYEGTLADFDEETWENIEVKTNAKDNDRSDLRKLVEALESSDETLVEALAPLLDLEQFRTFWAVETLIGHWDGYAETANNYYLYHDPGSDQFVFIPWGLDQAFTGKRGYDPRPYDPTVYAGAKLTERLYGITEQRDLYRERLGALNDTLWDAPALVARSKAIAALAPDADPTALAAHLDVMGAHGDAVRVALAKPPAAPETLMEQPAVPPTCVGSRPLVARFETRWGTGAGEVSAEAEFDGQPRTLQLVATMSWADQSRVQASLNMFTPLDAENGLVIALQLPVAQVGAGRHRFHALETFGLVGRTDGNGAFGFLGFVGDGAIEFDRASTDEGALIAGRLEGVFYQTACLDPSLAETP